jgi:hypothetical protein
MERPAAMSEQDHNQTTTFQAKFGGALLSLGTKSPLVLIAIVATGALVFNALQTWDLRIRLDVVSLSIREMTRSIRELTCLQYIPEAERSSNSGQAAACRKVGEMQ